MRAPIEQTIAAEDYRDTGVTFRGQLRATDIAGQAGLHLAAVAPFDALLRDHGSSLTGPGSSDWAWHEVTVPVGGEATGIRFGISLAGRGRVELRNPELSPSGPGPQE